jgi:hypothetical protein
MVVLVSRLCRVVYAEEGSHVWIDSWAQEDTFGGVECCEGNVVEAIRTIAMIKTRS